MTIDLTDEETESLTRLLRHAIDDDRYRLSPRVQTWQTILDKLRSPPLQEALPEPKRCAGVALGRMEDNIVILLVLVSSVLRTATRHSPATATVKPYNGPPMTLSNAAAAHVRLMVWCKACGHQIEPDAAEMVARYGPETTVIDWSARLICSRCGSRDTDMVATGTERR